METKYWIFENIEKKKEDIVGKWLIWLSEKRRVFFDKVVELNEPCKISTLYGAKNYQAVTKAQLYNYVVCIYTSEKRKNLVKKKLIRIGITRFIYKYNQETASGNYSNKDWEAKGS